MKKMVPSDLPISDAVTAVKEQNDYAAKNDSLICGEYHGEKLTYVDIHRLCVSCAFKTPQSVPTVFVPGVKGQILTESLFGCEREAYLLLLGSSTAGIFTPRGRGLVNVQHQALRRLLIKGGTWCS